MTDYTTIRVTEDAKAEAEQSKRDDETWNEYIQRCTENPPEVREYVPAGDIEVSAQIDYAHLADKVSDQVVQDLR